MTHPSTPDTTEAELEKLIGKRCTTKDTDDFPELRDDDPARCFVCKTWEAIDRHRQVAVDEAYQRGYNTGFQKGKRIRLRPSKVAEQLRTIADTIDNDNKHLLADKRKAK